MTNEELIQEMIEQALEDALLGYRDHHQYDDAATTPVEIDYTTQSWTLLKMNLNTSSSLSILLHPIMLQEENKSSHQV